MTSTRAPFSFLIWLGQVTLAALGIGLFFATVLYVFPPPLLTPDLIQKQITLDMRLICTGGVAGRPAAFDLELCKDFQWP